MNFNKITNNIKYKYKIKKLKHKATNQEIFNQIEQEKTNFNQLTQEQQDILNSQNKQQQNNDNNNDLDTSFIKQQNISEEEEPQFLSLLQDLQKLNLQIQDKSYNGKNFDNDLKQNADPLYQYNCIENVGFSYLNMIKHNNLLNSASILAAKTGPLVLSDINYLNLVWIYRRYKLLIDKIICYHLNRSFCFLKIFNKKTINDSEADEEFNKDIQKAQFILENINKNIFDAILLSEKYGGSILYLDLKDYNNNKLYNRFDISQENNGVLYFKDNTTLNKNDCIIFQSSYAPDTIEEKQRRQGWNYAWLDVCYEFLTTIIKSIASENEFISKMQVVVLYSNSLSNNNFNNTGYSATHIANKISNATNNSVITLNKDNDRLEYATSNVNIAPILDFIITQLSIYFSVPKSFFNEDAGNSGVINNSADKIGTTASLNECHRLKQHYQPQLQQILTKIFNEFIKNKQNITIQDLYIDTDITKHETNKMEEIEYQLKQEEVKEKQASVKEMESRFNYNTDE